MREVPVLSSTSCLIMITANVKGPSFMYELEVAQAAPHHLVMVQDGMGQVVERRSSKFFGTPFLAGRGNETTEEVNVSSFVKSMTWQINFSVLSKCYFIF